MQWRRHTRWVGCVHTPCQENTEFFVYLISELFRFVRKTYSWSIVKKWQAYTVVNLILKKISKIGATRCQILRLKCTKSDFGWGSAPDPAGGAYSGPPGP